MASLSELEQFIAGGFYKEGTAMGFPQSGRLFLTLVTTMIVIRGKGLLKK